MHSGSRPTEESNHGCAYKSEIGEACGGFLAAELPSNETPRRERTRPEWATRKSPLLGACAAEIDLLRKR